MTRRDDEQPSIIVSADIAAPGAPQDPSRDVTEKIRAPGFGAMPVAIPRVQAAVPGSERRQEARYPCSVAVQLFFAGAPEPVALRCVSLSDSGLFLATDDAPVPGQEVGLRFEEEVGHPVEARARVVRIVLPAAARMLGEQAGFGVKLLVFRSGEDSWRRMLERHKVAPVK